MRGGTLFSGIGAPEQAMPWVDWRWCAEIDPFASAVHAARFPGIVNLGDVNAIEAPEPVDLVVFGSPCQSFSIAGKRGGLDDPRGDLALVGLRVVGRIRPRWVVWENVPGILSSGGGRDFGAFLGLLGELGYGFAYRVLDAQHFGVPQRRRRVFVVGCLGDWRSAAAILFEPESLRGDPPPRREAGQGIARPVASCAPGGSGYRCDADTADNLIAPTLRGANPYCDHAGDERRLIPLDIVPAMTTRTGTSTGRDGMDDYCVPIAFSAKDHGSDCGEIAPTLRAGSHDKSHANAGVMPAFAYDRGPAERPVAMQAMSVRRLTPRECERLQGLPDNWTAITYRGKPAADGSRYRAIGNSMAVPVIGWIGHRIQQYESAMHPPASGCAA